MAPTRSSRRLVLSVAVVATSLALAACTSSKNAQSTNSSPSGKSHATTLHIALLDDMGVPDPDVFYGSEGLMVTDSVYEGLLQYANNSTTIIPSLASLPTVSSDGLTYTFTLHAGVTFHDGTALTSAAVKSSFARRTKINQGPAYMLAAVTSVDTPSALTAVVHLSHPVSAFLDYMASPWGPKILSPAEISAHTVAGDEGQKWLGSHDAGSGPYTITSFIPNQKYVLSRFDGYWGTKAGFAEVDFAIQPSITTQELELEKGQLDMVMHGLSSQDLKALANKSGLVEHQYPAEVKTVAFVNPHSGPFTSVAARDALAQVLDKAKLTEEVFGKAGTASTQIYPTGQLPPSATSSVVKYDPSVLKALVPSLPSKKVDIGYDATEPRNQLMAELIQLELQSVGLTVTTRSIPIAQIYSFPQHLDQAPTILIQTTVPDAAHPDTWGRIYMSKGGGANYMQCIDPAVDAALDAGLASTTHADVVTNYGNAGNLISKNACFIDISDVQDIIVTRAGLTGLYHVPAEPSNFNLATIANG